MEARTDKTLHIHPLLSARSSPRAFAARPVEPAKLRALFEAARWAPSSYNDQPWSFIVATRENTAGYLRLLSVLARPNAQWARQAPVLALAVGRLNLNHSGQPNRHAFYDVGQAVANLTVQATALGLAVHQMGGFDVEQAREQFGLPKGQEPVVVLALGYRGDAEPLRAAERAPRTRKPLEEFVFTERWGKVAPLVLETAKGGGQS